MSKEVYQYNIQVLEGILNQIEEDLRDITHKLDEVRIKKLSISYIVDYLKKDLDIVEDKKEFKSEICRIQVPSLDDSTNSKKE